MDFGFSPEVEAKAPSSAHSSCTYLSVLPTTYATAYDLPLVPLQGQEVVRLCFFIVFTAGNCDRIHLFYEQK